MFNFFNSQEDNVDAILYRAATESDNECPSTEPPSDDERHHNESDNEREEEESEEEILPSTGAMPSVDSLLSDEVERAVKKNDAMPPKTPSPTPTPISTPSTPLPKPKPTPPPARGHGKKGPAMKSVKMAAVPKGVKRHTKKVRPAIYNITNPSLRRLARRGGVKRMAGEVYDDVRGAFKEFLEKIVHDACLYMDYAHRRTVTVNDVVYALRRNGKMLYA